MRSLQSQEYQEYKNSHINPLVKYAAKCFSQSDEDGITLELIRRVIDTPTSTYLEVGIGNGMENNTLVLSALGWQGQWIGNEDLVVAHKNYTKAFITKDNILDLINVNPSVISIDLDGNDYHVLKTILTKHDPDILILEYNGKFIPPIQWVMPYEEKHTWDGSDYFGASLESFVILLFPAYLLVACNPATGANAFFIKADHWEKFPEMFKQLFLDDQKCIYNLFTTRQIWVPPFYQMDLRHGHIPFARTINTFI